MLWIAFLLRDGLGVIRQDGQARYVPFIGIAIVLLLTLPPGKNSKRVPVRLRHKIEKASAAKQRKQRKLAKKVLPLLLAQLCTILLHTNAAYRTLSGAPRSRRTPVSPTCSRTRIRSSTRSKRRDA